MDWRAVEQNEQVLREAIAASLAENTEASLSYAAAAELQLAFSRPWLTWLAKHRDHSNRAVYGLTLNIASFLAETATNAEFINEKGESRPPEDAILHLAKQAARIALTLYRQHVKAVADGTRVEQFGMGVDLDRRADA